MRLFVAVNFEPVVLDALAGVADALRREEVSGVFTRRENFHLTLAFLGEVPRPDGAMRAMDRVDAHAFSLGLGGLGRFRREGGDIWWLGVSAPPELGALQRALAKELIREGFSLEERDYRPHLTLGRQVRLERALGRDVFPAVAQVQVSEFCLMRSDRIDGRLTYRKIYTKCLKEGKDNR